MVISASYKFGLRYPYLHWVVVVQYVYDHHSVEFGLGGIHIQVLHIDRLAPHTATLIFTGTQCVESSPIQRHVLELGEAVGHLVFYVTVGRLVHCVTSIMEHHKSFMGLV